VPTLRSEKYTHLRFLSYLRGKCLNFYKIFSECLGGISYFIGGKVKYFSLCISLPVVYVIASKHFLKMLWKSDHFHRNIKKREWVFYFLNTMYIWLVCGCAVGISWTCWSSSCRWSASHWKKSVRESFRSTRPSSGSCEYSGSHEVRTVNNYTRTLFALKLLAKYPPYGLEGFLVTVIYQMAPRSTTPCVKHYTDGQPAT